MPTLKIPNTFYEGWFWFVLALIIFVIEYFLRKKSAPPFPNAGNFFKRHEKTIIKIADIFIICMILLYSLMIIRGLSTILYSPEIPYPPEQNETIPIQSDWAFLFTMLTIWSGLSGFFIGQISVFWSNLTKTKRIILFIICLLPIVFTGLQLVADDTLDSWSIIRSGLYCSTGSWIINAPAIFAGKHIFHILEGIHQKLKLLFSTNSV